jgi:hypothetical protein
VADSVGACGGNVEQGDADDHYKRKCGIPSFVVVGTHGRGQSGDVKRDGHRRIAVRSEGDPSELAALNPTTGNLHLPLPVEGDIFVPRYAYKAIIRIALSIMPQGDLRISPVRYNVFKRSKVRRRTGRCTSAFRLAMLETHRLHLPDRCCAGVREPTQLLYMVAIFTAGNVCFQI